jgi:hypothetical protein
MQLFQPEKKGTVNDPYMINPKGARVQVTASLVPELLAKGFVLEDRTWKPQIQEKVEEVLIRDFPIPRKKLLEETQKQIDTLDVWEV